MSCVRCGGYYDARIMAPVSVGVARAGESHTIEDELAKRYIW